MKLILTIFVLSLGIQSSWAFDKFVLIINSYHAGQKFSDKVLEGVSEKISSNSKNNIHFRIENINSFDNHNQGFEESFARGLKTKYIQRPDLLVAVDDFALSFLKKYRKQIWGELPIFFIGLGNETKERFEDYKKITGIQYEIPYLQMMEKAQLFHPEIKRYVFIYGSRDNKNEFKSKIESYKDKFAGIEFTYFSDQASFFKDGLTKNDDSSLIFLSGLLNEDFLHSLQKINSPKYSFWGPYLGEGIIGGKLVQGLDLGKQAGELIGQILLGADIENIPLKKINNSSFTFDLKEINKWKIPHDRIPLDSIVDSNPVDFFHENKFHFFSFGSLLVFFIILFFVFIFYYWDRKKILRHLHEKNERLSSLTANISDIVLFRTKADSSQSVLFLSDAMKGLIGCEQNEIDELIKMVHPEDISFFKNEHERQMKNGGTFEIDYRIINNDKKIKYIKERGRIVQTNDGEVIDGVLIDMTLVKNLEKEKNQIQHQLFQSARLASVGTLVAGVAHEINNPLAIMQGYFDILRRTLEKKGWLDETFKGYFENGKQSLDRISSIVNGLRTFAKSDQDNYGPVNIHKVIEDTAGLCQPIFSKMDITIHYKLEAPFFLVHGNEGKIQQIIMNILTNSRDAICYSERKMDGHITIISSLGSGSLCLKIEDNGCGISKENCLRVFDPFFTTKPPGKGIGLGLSIAHSLIELMNGSIDIYSQEKMGTTVTLNLPLSLSVPHSEIIQKLLIPTQRKVSVSGMALVVDDEEGMRKVLRNYLEMFGLEVFEAENGNVALKMIKAQKFSYVFIDHHMPVMDGAQLLEEIYDLKAIGVTSYYLMTGGFIDDVLTPRLKKIVMGYLSKPFDQEDLAKILKIR